MRIHTGLALLLSLGLAAGPNAWAQVISATEAAPPSASAADFKEVIVTGRAGIEQRTEEETSYSVTTIDQKKLRQQGPTSVTESLKSVPGFWVESSGGEASG